MRVAYGEALRDIGGLNEKVVVCDADLAHATMTNIFAEKYPERFFNFGIAEANMAGVAAGLAAAGRGFGACRRRSGAQQGLHQPLGKLVFGELRLVGRGRASSPRSRSLRPGPGRAAP